MSLRVGLIGLGAIGSVVARHLAAVEGVTLAAILVRPGRAVDLAGRVPGIAPVEEVTAFLAGGLDLAVECAGQDAVRAHAEAVLDAGTDLMVVSTGALAEDAVLDRLSAAATRSGARLLVPAGAIAGLDGLGALKEAGLERVVYTSTKPPAAWRGTPAERLLDLSALDGPRVFFEGSAREAALAYPKNANLAATVALAGLGLDRTTVRLVADPAASGNTGRVEAVSRIGTLRVEMAGEASANPKTSASTAFSLVHAVRTRAATLAI